MIGSPQVVSGSRTFINLTHEQVACTIRDMFPMLKKLSVEERYISILKICNFQDWLFCLHLIDGTLGVVIFIFIAVSAWFPHSLVEVSSL